MLGIAEMAYRNSSKINFQCQQLHGKIMKWEGIGSVYLYGYELVSVSFFDCHQFEKWKYHHRHVTAMRRYMRFRIRRTQIALEIIGPNVNFNFRFVHVLVLWIHLKIIQPTLERARCLSQAEFGFSHLYWIPPIHTKPQSIWNMDQVWMLARAKCGWWHLNAKKCSVNAHVVFVGYNSYIDCVLEDSMWRLCMMRMLSKYWILIIFWTWKIVGDRVFTRL